MQFGEMLAESLPFLAVGHGTGLLRSALAELGLAEVSGLALAADVLVNYPGQAMFALGTAQAAADMAGAIRRGDEYEAWEAAGRFLGNMALMGHTIERLSLQVTRAIEAFRRWRNAGEVLRRAGIEAYAGNLELLERMDRLNQEMQAELSRLRQERGPNLARAEWSARLWELVAERDRLQDLNLQEIRLEQLGRQRELQFRAAYEAYQRAIQGGQGRLNCESSQALGESVILHGRRLGFQEGAPYSQALEYLRRANELLGRQGEGVVEFRASSGSRARVDLATGEVLVYRDGALLDFYRMDGVAEGARAGSQVEGVARGLIALARERGAAPGEILRILRRLTENRPGRLPREIEIWMHTEGELPEGIPREASPAWNRMLETLTRTLEEINSSSLPPSQEALLNAARWLTSLGTVLHDNLGTMGDYLPLYQRAWGLYDQAVRRFDPEPRAPASREGSPVIEITPPERYTTPESIRVARRLLRARQDIEQGFGEWALDELTDAETLLWRAANEMPAVEFSRLLLESTRLRNDHLPEALSRELRARAWREVLSPSEREALRDLPPEQARARMEEISWERARALIREHLRRTLQISRERPQDVLGEISSDPTRLQNFNDCSLHAIYNHPLLRSLWAKRYPEFMRAVERIFDIDFRTQGVNAHMILRALDLRPGPETVLDSEAALVEHMRSEGALLGRLGPFSSPEGRVTHAVVISLAWRESGGEWRFLVTDSNSTAPYVASFRTLRALGLNAYSVRGNLAPAEFQLRFLSGQEGFFDTARR